MLLQVDPVDELGEVGLAVGALDQLVLVGVLGEDVLLQHHEHARQLRVDEARVLARHGRAVLELAAGRGAPQLHRAVIPHLATDLLSVTKIYVGNDFVGGVEVHQ